ncbi:MAG TPA: cysteine desulfurase, partial [Plasticicumulans sp.]|nr:cysteine desulfurase [Plasticicumulans sp.]
MNMPTPTSEAAAAAALPGSLAPPGLPDVAGLTQLASAFFAMLPGETMAAALPGLAQLAPSLTAAQPPAS